MCGYLISSFISVPLTKLMVAHVDYTHVCMSLIKVYTRCEVVHFPNAFDRVCICLGAAGNVLVMTSPIYTMAALMTLLLVWL